MCLMLVGVVNPSDYEAAWGMDIYEVVYYVLSPKSKFRKNVNFKKYKNVKNRKIIKKY